MMSIKENLIKLINEADAIVIGAGAGLSTAAGFEYGGEFFKKHFPEMYKLGYKEMYSAGFHHFDTLEEKWGYWSKHIFYSRYQGVKELYKDLLSIVKNKNYFVITTNVDHQFQLAGFDKNRLFYMQGDYGLFQCSVPCHKKTYDNEEMVFKMIKSINDNKIPSHLIPKCPICGKPMDTNLRCDDTFVEDTGWNQAKRRYEKFISDNKDKNIIYLELGVGYSTPVWIKYPFMKLTYMNPSAKYIVIDNGYINIPKEIEKQTTIINDDIKTIFR